MQTGTQGNSAKGVAWYRAPSNPLTPGGHRLFAIFRPKDPLYACIYPDEAPTVATKVPFAETKINNLERVRDILKGDWIPRHPVRITKVVHNNTYTDLIHGLNKFYLKKPDELVNGVLGNHLAEFMVTGNPEIPYHKIILHQHCHKDAIHFADHLDQVQQEAYTTMMAHALYFKHGVGLIAGVPAAGKSVLQEKITLAWALGDVTKSTPSSPSSYRL